MRALLFFTLLLHVVLLHIFVRLLLCFHCKQPLLVCLLLLHLVHLLTRCNGRHTLLRGVVDVCNRNLGRVVLISQLLFQTHLGLDLCDLGLHITHLVSHLRLHLLALKLEPSLRLFCLTLGLCNLCLNQRLRRRICHSRLLHLILRSLLLLFNQFLNDWRNALEHLLRVLVHQLCGNGQCLLRRAIQLTLFV